VSTGNMVLWVMIMLAGYLVIVFTGSEAGFSG
jgi:hypothetical protein